MGVQRDNELALPDQRSVFYEPPLDTEDTTPNSVVESTVKKSSADQPRDRGVGPTHWFLWAATIVVMIITVVVYLQQNSRLSQLSRVSIVVTQTLTAKSDTPPTSTPTQTVTTHDSEESVPADVVAELLMEPAASAPPSDQIYRKQTAYTIAPPRPRTESISYKIQQGDTLDSIAQRFGLKTETLVWNNETMFVNRLLPGDTLIILPQDGVLHKTIGEETIQAIADQHKVSPYAIIDTEYNKLQNARPETILPASMTVMVPGGIGTKKAAYWDPGVTIQKGSVTTGGAGASLNTTGQVSFGGGSGSCGYQSNVGGSGSLRLPLPPGYQVTRGFSAFHGGIDLAMANGTAVFAADSGTVIFAGWSEWGFGDTVVLAHGTMLTLYGHLSRINVSCGQLVRAGQTIGTVGNTGNSSGPHLHFEIRPGAGAPVDPLAYLAF